MRKNHTRTKGLHGGDQMAQLDERTVPPPRKHALHADAVQVSVLLTLMSAARTSARRSIFCHDVSIAEPCSRLTLHPTQHK